MRVKMNILLAEYACFLNTCQALIGTFSVALGLHVIAL
jgi:hypothetical protein